MLEMNINQEMNDEQDHPKEKNDPIRLEKLELVISLPREFVPLVEKMTRGSQQARDTLFTNAVVERLDDISDEPEELLPYMKNIDEAQVSALKGLNKYHGREKYKNLTEPLERHMREWQELVPLDTTLTLSSFLLASLEGFSDITENTKEILCACFIIDLLDNIVWSPEMLLGHVKNGIQFYNILKAGLKQNEELTRLKEEDNAGRM